jgi:hypothetical protein
MAPYNPPSTHYSQMDVSEYSEDQIFAFMGKTGKKFYWLTHRLGLDYLWYDKKRKVFEIWGPYYTHTNQQSQHLIRCEIDYFLAPKLEASPSEYQQPDVQETVATC